MITYNQLIKGIRKFSKKKTKVPALQKCPQKRGVCLKVMTMTPRKPNSAMRRVAKVRLSTGKRLIIFIPGEGYNSLKMHSSVLVAGKGSRDLPGVSYHAIRGKFDLIGIPVRMSSRSRYGTKKPKKK